MQLIETICALQDRADAERAAGRRIALVPTMGALHAGHLALVEEARRRAQQVWVSIFVNPTQFENAGDLVHYPRALDVDFDVCRDAGVDLVFAPASDEMYPLDSETSVEVADLSKPLCGARRDGHFRAVCTIVAKLLLAAKPHVAVFGEKDYQQLAVIRRMVRDLNFDVEIVGAPIVREADGLALSSRNRNLDGEARRQATALVHALSAAESAVAAGERDTARILHATRAEIAKAPRARIDYAELRDPGSLAPAPARLDGPALLALAVFMQTAGSEGESVRLIDNRVLHPHDTGAG